MDFALARAQHGYSESVASEPFTFSSQAMLTLWGGRSLAITSCRVCLLGHWPLPECTHSTAWIAIPFTYMVDFIYRLGLTLNPSKEFAASYVNLCPKAGARGWKL